MTFAKGHGKLLYDENPNLLKAAEIKWVFGFRKWGIMFVRYYRSWDKDKKVWEYTK
jgi:hypothetical protein